MKLNLLADDGVDCCDERDKQVVIKSTANIIRLDPLLFCLRVAEGSDPPKVGKFAVVLWSAGSFFTRGLSF